MRIMSAPTRNASSVGSEPSEPGLATPSIRGSGGPPIVVRESPKNRQGNDLSGPISFSRLNLANERPNWSVDEGGSQDRALLRPVGG